MFESLILQNIDVEVHSIPSLSSIDKIGKADHVLPVSNISPVDHEALSVTIHASNAI